MFSMSDYNIENDTTFEREKLTNMIHHGDRSVWNLERCVYDIRHDLYWLVTKNRTGYKFVGPVALSADLIDLLPTMTELERRAVLRHAPQGYTEASYGEDVEFINADEPDGA